jgi:hypothetical protein
VLFPWAEAVERAPLRDEWWRPFQPTVYYALCPVCGVEAYYAFEQGSEPEEWTHVCGRCNQKYNVRRKS